MHLKHLCLDKAFTFLLFDPSALGVAKTHHFHAREVVVKDYLINKGQVYVKGEHDGKTIEINVPFDAETMILTGIYDDVRDIAQAFVVPEDPNPTSSDDVSDDETPTTNKEPVVETV